MYGVRNSVAVGVSGHVALTTSNADTIILDLYPNAAAAYSLRKLRTAYSGSAIRVRRSSDNTEQDIGFTGSGALDESALSTFIGANNGFVTTFYDQSGNARNATQATAANQPQIVASGVINRQNGKPSISFNGTSHGFDLLSSLSIFRNVGYAYGFCVSQNPVTTVGTRSLYSFSSTTTTNARFAAAYNVVANTIRVTARILDTDVNTNRDSNNHNALLNVHTAAARYANDTIQSIINSQGTGTTVLAGVAGNTDNTDSAIAYIGRNLNGLNYFNGSLCELIFYNTDQNNNRAAIESNQISFYGIT